MNRALRILLPMMCLAIIMGGCSKKSDTTAPADTEAPVVAIVSPVADQNITTTTLSAAVTATDNNAVTKVEFYFDAATTPVVTLTSAPWTANIIISALADGAHAIIVKAYDEAGNIGTATVNFIKGTAPVNDDKRMALVEIVTSANCPPCGPANEYFNSKVSTGLVAARLAIVRYHVWWPATTDQLWIDSQTWSRPRTQYLFNPLTSYIAPCGWVDGTYGDSNPDNWLSFITEDLKKPAEAKIELSKVDQGSNVVVTIKVKGLSSSAFTDLRLHTALTESEIHYNDGNSEFVHYEVMRQMYPDANGESITLADNEEKTFTRTMAISSAWAKDNLKAVVFLQSNSSKKVLQAARISLK